MTFVPNIDLDFAALRITGGKVEVKLHLRPFGSIVHIIHKGVGRPVTVAYGVVNAHYDVGLGVGISLE